MKHKLTRLKSASRKRAALNRSARDWRRDFAQGVGACDLCRVVSLDVVCHEIARANRPAAFTCPACILVLCDPCHREVHDQPRVWSKARQLAFLLRRREWAFDLVRYNAVAIKRVSIEDVQNERVSE